MNTFRQRFALMVLSVAAAMPVAAFAQDFKMGFVNADRIFRESAPARQALQKLDQEFSKREKETVEMGNALKAATEKFEREASTLSESQRTARQRALVEQEREFQRKRREFQEDLNARKNEEQQQVVERANRAINQIAAAEKYDVILQQDPNYVVYVLPRHDITDKVLKALNGGAK